LELDIKKYFFSPPPRCLIVEPNDELTSIPYRLTVDVISNELNTNTLLRRMDAIFSLHEESSEALVDFNTEFSSEPPLTYLEKVMFIQHEICSSEVILIAFFKVILQGKWSEIWKGTSGDSGLL